MIARLGNVIYWAGLLMCMAAVYNIGIFVRYSDVPKGYTTHEIDWELISFYIGLVLVPWAIRYILSGNKSIKP